MLDKIIPLQSRIKEEMIIKRRCLLLLTAAVLAVPLVSSAQFPGFGKKKKKQKPSRSVTGQVMDEAEEGLRGVVQLKNTRTLEVKSFHTNEVGEYYFHGLDFNVDYEIKAIAENRQSRTRTISTFSSRSELIYNFKLKPAN